MMSLAQKHAGIAAASRGYSLIEIALALLVLGILLSAVLLPLQARLTTEQLHEVDNTLEQARTAVVAFAISHRTAHRQLNYGGVIYDIPAGRPYLPCPDIDNDGVEDRAANTTDEPLPVAELTVAMTCREHKGLLPWRTLGMRVNTDPWGNRIGYRVDPSFASGLLGFDETFRADMFDPRLPMMVYGVYEKRASWDAAGAIVCSEFDDNGCPRADLRNVVVGLIATTGITLGARAIPAYDEDEIEKDGAPTGLFDGAVFVLFSHGKNGHGAVAGVSGKCRPPPLSEDNLTERANAYYRDGHALVVKIGCEREDNNLLAENLFVSAPPQREGHELAGADDIVLWMSANEITGDLLQAGVLPVAKLDFLPDE